MIDRPKKGTDNYYLRFGDNLVRASADREVYASPKDFDSEQKNVILIHGFTAHGRYLQPLASILEQNDFNTFLFNYNSYQGIARAAQSLFDLLTEINKLRDNVLKKKRVSFVCHSMGGLVARAFCEINEATDFISTIVTIGTPHNGTLDNMLFLKSYIKWGEFKSGYMPGYTKKCQSMKELTKKDSYELTGIPLIDTMNQATNSNGVPIFSISGGKKYLEVGKNPVLNYAINRATQYFLGREDNDGLVPESSSDVTRNLVIDDQTKNDHLNDYSDYPDLNHSYLIENQRLGLKIASWLQDQSR